MQALCVGYVLELIRIAKGKCYSIHAFLCRWIIFLFAQCLFLFVSLVEVLKLHDAWDTALWRQFSKPLYSFCTLIKLSIFIVFIELPIHEQYAPEHNS